MIISGAKGSMFNTVQITSAIGQQNLEGKRVPKTCGGRTLPCYVKSLTDDCSPYAPDKIPVNKVLSDEENMKRLFQSRGFITSSYYSGLSPQEFFFLSAGGREGLIDTSCKTSKCGYISRRILKLCEDLKISSNGTVVNSKGNIIQYAYGDDGFNAAELIKTKNYGYQCCDIEHIVDELNMDVEWAMFKNK